MKTLLVGTLLLVGCSSHEAEQPLTHDLTEAVDQADELRTATMEHRERIASSTNMADIDEEENRYHEQAEGHLGMMRGEIDEMMQCRNSSGSVPNTASLSRLRDQCGGEIAAHERAMGDAVDVPAALAEEDRFQEVMMNRLNETVDVGHRMMGEMGGMSACDVENDMHHGMMH